MEELRSLPLSRAKATTLKVPAVPAAEGRHRMTSRPGIEPMGITTDPDNVPPSPSAVGMLSAYSGRLAFARYTGLLQISGGSGPTTLLGALCSGSILRKGVRRDSFIGVGSPGPLGRSTGAARAPAQVTLTLMVVQHPCPLLSGTVTWTP